MKKILFIPLLAVLFTIAGCNNDDDVNLQKKISDTTWERDEKLGGADSHTDIYTHIELQSRTFSLSHREIKTYDDGSFLETNHAINGTYQYNPPKLILTEIDDDNNERKIEFTVFKNYISNNEYGSLNKK